MFSVQPCRNASKPIPLQRETEDSGILSSMWNFLLVASLLLFLLSACTVFLYLAQIAVPFLFHILVCMFLSSETPNSEHARVEAHETRRPNERVWALLNSLFTLPLDLLVIPYYLGKYLQTWWCLLRFLFTDERNPTLNTTLLHG